MLDGPPGTGQGSPPVMQLRTFVALSLALFVCFTGCDNPTPGIETQVDAGADVKVPPRVTSARVRVDRSLMESFQDAYVGRRGAVFGPGIPGWSRLSQLTGQPAWHRSTKLDGRVAAWFDGIGATVGFPIGPEGPSLRMLSVWLYPVAPRQAASVFLDDKPLATIQLKSGWHRYDFPLPPSGLGEGEHRLRFWFRFSAVRRRVKTPAALGTIELRAANELPSPQSWFSVLESQSSRPLAGPPSRWSLGTMIPPEGHISARAHVESGGPVDFIIRVEEDGVGRLEVARVKVTRGQTADIGASLKRWAGRLVRLSFGTDGMADVLQRASWSEVRLSGELNSSESPSSARNLVVWSVEGMWSQDPRLGREGARAATPNLDLLYEQGAAALQAWSGGSGAREAHTRILAGPRGASISPELATAGVTTGLFTSNPRFSKRLRDGFQTRSVPTSRGDRFQPERVLSAFDDWVYAHGKKPFFAYVDAVSMGSSSRRSQDDESSYSGSNDVVHESLARSDYWLGQMLGILERHGTLSETVIVVVGLPSRSLRTAPSNPHRPERLYSPLVIWHPDYANKGVGHRDFIGADFMDIGDTIRGLMGLDDAPSVRERDLSASLLGTKQLWPTPVVAKTPHGWAIGYGDWVFWPRAKPENRLWRRSTHGSDLADISAYPIVVRALRDRIATVPGGKANDR